MIYPKREEFIKLAAGANIVPVVREIHSDTQTPIGIFMQFAGQQNSFLLESVEGGEKWARYSFIGRSPYMTFSANGDEITIVENGKTRKTAGNPLEALKALFAQFIYAKLDGLPRFAGGAIGYFAYDAVRYIEDLPGAPPDDMNVPDCYLMFCDEVIAYDHLQQKVMVIVNAHVNSDAAGAYDMALKRLEETGSALEAGAAAPKKAAGGGAKTAAFASNFSKDQFCAAVEQAKQYIYDGDVFQVVLSQRLAVETQADPFDVYRILRTLNPSPYLYYLNLPDAVIVGSCRSFWCAWRTTLSKPARSRVRGRAAKPPRRTTRWRTTCCRTKRSWPSIRCWSTSAATTSARSPSSAAWWSRTRCTSKSIRT